MRILRAAGVSGLLLSFALASSAQQQTKNPDAVLQTMQTELSRAAAGLKKAEPAAYFLSYNVDDEDGTVITATHGAVITSVRAKRRLADVSVRVGSPALDNTHGDNRGSGNTPGQLAIADDPGALSHDLWELTDKQYKQAAQAFTTAQAQRAVKAEEEDKSPDFSAEKPAPAMTLPVNTPLTPDVKVWEDRLRRISSVFNKHPLVYESGAMLYVTNDRRRFVSSENVQVSSGVPLARVFLIAQTTAEDGMQLMRVETFEAPALDGLPQEAALIEHAEKMARDVEKLRLAPIAEPFNGPALLSGRAAAVFFHEVLGHRLEGQRQRGEEEGQTFTKQVGKSVLPAFLSVSDDPTLRVLQDVPLAGYYAFDDEGIPSQRVDVIQKGILKQFLMSRMPVKDFLHSNGHGRAQAGFMPVARQGNLIVTSTNGVPEKELRNRFLQEIKAQKKPYGLYFEDIEGGFTLTTRSEPQAFQVLPVMVWRVYADGRPDQLVRGVDIVGTPLAALNRIVQTGDKQFVFNGLCGAESGSVPVSAAAPAMLFSEIEVQRKAQGHDRPPILPAPASAGGGR